MVSIKTAPIVPFLKTLFKKLWSTKACARMGSNKGCGPSPRTNDQHRTKIPTWDPKFQTCFLPIKNYREPTMGNPKRIFKFRDARSFFPRQTQKFLRYKTQLCHHGRPATDGELLFYRDQRWKFTVPAYLLVAGSHTHSFTTSFWVNRTWVCKVRERKCIRISFGMER